MAIIKDYPPQKAQNNKTEERRDDKVDKEKRAKLGGWRRIIIAKRKH